MTEPSDRHAAGRRQVDEICDEFEAGWTTGDEPNLADYLGRVSEPMRDTLFHELLLSDMECRYGNETTCDTGFYLRTFPERRAQILAILRGLTSSRISKPTRRSESLSIDETVGAPSGDRSMPEQCGSYTLLEEVARGGMGVVYRAYDEKLQRTVAVKMILDRNLASGEAVERFHAEAEMTAGLEHPGIVPVYDVGVHEGHHFYAMGFVEGPTLSQLLKQRTFSIDESVQFVIDLSDAVAYAHEHGVVHRDLKPGNILMGDDGQPKITDFGLAKRTDRPSHLTMAGQVIGTPGYMAPEQAAGETENMGPAADVYALGAILYHLLTGHAPFRTSLDALASVVEQDPMPPRVLNRRVPRDLNVVCMKCLSRKPQERFASVRELLADLLSFQEGELIQARPASRRRRVLQWARHRPRLATVWLIMAAFYLYHLALYMAGNEGSLGWFHWVSTATVLLVCVYGWFFQRLLLRPQAGRAVLYGWVVTDVVVFTLFVILAADGPTSPLIPIYFCMVSGAALSFDRYLVWVVTGSVVVSYLLVVATAPWLHPDMPLPEFRRTVPVAISILAIGLVQYFVLRCSRLHPNPISRYRS